ncbi:MAG: efflux RND transporter permease subunit [Phycisphaerales bacterium]|jgi:HAE1 family hydrophobic/amphiphilic exporter-1
MSLPAFGVRKPVVANLLMFAIIGAGILLGLGLRREFFPEVRPNRVVVAAPYPGASPDEIERSLAIKIEDRVADLRDVVEINTTVTEGSAQLIIEFEDSVDIDEAVSDVKREVDSLQDLPEQSERIIVDKLEPNLPAVILSIYGDTSERALKEAALAIREDLRALPGMADVTIDGIRTDEIRVSVRPQAMVEHQLSLPMISDRVRAAMRELPGGTVRTGTQTLSVRTVRVEEDAKLVADIVVKGEGGRVLRLGDIADVEYGFRDTDLITRLEGQPAVSLTCFQVGDTDVVKIAELTKAYTAGMRGEPLELTIGERIGTFLREMQNKQLEAQGKPLDLSPVSDRLQAYESGQKWMGRLPGEARITTDLARFVTGRLELLTRNALQGGALVFLVLVLLLNWRVSFWVAIGLIISLAGTIAMMRMTGITLNLLTMFGLIVVIGILVDDAIVVAENIVARHEEGMPPMQAAIEGAGQVSWPVVTTVLTTVFAFLPLALIEGQIGDFLAALPIVVAVALLVSLIECLFILPSHMAHTLRSTDRAERTGTASRLARFEARYDHWRDRLFSRLLIPHYTRMLVRCLRYRYLTLALAISIVIASAAMVAGGKLEFIFFETEDAESVNVTLRMPIGTPVGETDAIVRRIEQASLDQPEVASAYASVGAIGDVNGEGGDISQPHLGQIFLELNPVEQRDRTSNDVILAIREQLGELAGVKSLRFEPIGGGPGGVAISLGVVGENTERATIVVDRLKAMLDEIEAVFDIEDDADAGQRELRFDLKDGATELGFTRASLGEQIRGAVFGLEPHTFAGNREDVKVRVTLPKETRSSPVALEDTYVFSPDGRAVPLIEVATIEEGRGYATVRRLDRERIITVSADVNRQLGNPEEIVGSLRPKLIALEREFPGIRIVERGRQKDVAESFATLPLGMAVAAGLIFVTLAWLFSSYMQPLIVMAAIPFATVGMIWGHLALGFAMTFLSLIGFVALSGIVVNDSLIFMEFFNERKRGPASLPLALVRAGRARLRPILLTTITTVLGLTPLMLEQSFQARFLIPMAITIACGLISATAIILLVLPSMLAILSDIKAVARLAWTGSKTKATNGNGLDERAPFNTP